MSTWLSSNLPFKKAFLIILGIICKNKSSNLWQIFTCDYWFCKFMSEWNLIISVLSPGLQSSRSSHCIAGVKFIENKQSTTLFYFKTKHTFFNKSKNLKIRWCVKNTLYFFLFFFCNLKFRDHSVLETLYINFFKFRNLDRLCHQ